MRIFLCKWMHSKCWSCLKYTANFDRSWKQMSLNLNVKSFSWVSYGFIMYTGTVLRLYHKTWGTLLFWLSIPDIWYWIKLWARTTNLKLKSCPELWMQYLIRLWIKILRNYLEISNDSFLNLKIHPTLICKSLWVWIIIIENG